MHKTSLLILLVIARLIIIPAKSDAQWMLSKGAERQIACTFVVKGSTIFAGANAGPIPDTTYIGGALRSTDYGATWIKIDSGFVSGTASPITVYSLVIVGDSLFAGTSNGVFLSSNDGTTWTAASVGIDSDASSRNVQAMLFTGSNIFAGTQNGIFFSSNRGTTWSRRDSGLAYPYNSVLCMTTDGSTIFAGINDGGVYLSTDAGKGWTHNHSTDGRSVQGLTLIDSEIFAGWQGVYGSINDTQSWISLSSGLTDTVHHDALYIESLTAVNRNLFAGTMGYGFYVSLDQGGNWTPENSDLKSVIDFDVFSIGSIGGYLLIGTGNTIWRRPLSEITTSVQKPHSNLPSGFTLYQNFPNPFNPTTTIHYQSSTNGFISLDLYDILGRKVKTLVSELQTAGTHSAILYAGDLASGTYFYRLTTRGFVSTKKMMVIK